MINTILIVFAIAALGGLVLASHVLRGRFAPWLLSLLHALLGALGLVLLIVLLVQGGASSQIALGFGLLVLAAMAAGLLELARVPEGRPLRDAYVHMGAMALALALFGARLIRGLDGMRPLAPDAVSLVLDVCGFAALVAGGWYGARLVYLHGVGQAR